MTMQTCKKGLCSTVWAPELLKVRGVTNLSASFYGLSFVAFCSLHVYGVGGFGGGWGDVNVPWFCAHARCFPRDAARLMLTHLEQNPERTLRKLESNLLKRLRGQAKWIVSDSHHQTSRIFNHIHTDGCKAWAVSSKHASWTMSQPLHNGIWKKYSQNHTKPYKTPEQFKAGWERRAEKLPGKAKEMKPRLKTYVLLCSARHEPGQICKSTKWREKKTRQVETTWNNSGKSLFQRNAFYSIFAGPRLCA